MSERMTQSERLTRIEVLLESAVTQRVEDREAMKRTIEDMAKDIRQIKTDLESVKTEQAALKSKGLGFLAGAGLAGGGVVAGILKLFGD
jgi:anti-sigma regulatory factor (Ser/Thr protein kinase)